jgi:hypothetical protein
VTNDRFRIKSCVRAATVMDDIGTCSPLKDNALSDGGMWRARIARRARVRGSGPISFFRFCVALLGGATRQARLCPPAAFHPDYPLAA